MGWTPSGLPYIYVLDKQCEREITFCTIFSCSFYFHCHVPLQIFKGLTFSLQTMVWVTCNSTQPTWYDTDKMILKLCQQHTFLGQMQKRANPILHPFSCCTCSVSQASQERAVWLFGLLSHSLVPFYWICRGFTWGTL